MGSEDQYARWLAVAPCGAQVHGTILRRAGNAVRRPWSDGGPGDYASVTAAGVGETDWEIVGGGMWECIAYRPDGVQPPEGAE